MVSRPYAAVITMLVLIVLGLVAGQAAVGSVTIGGDRDPLTASEEMATAAEAKLMPPQAYEDPWLVDTIREAVREGDIGTVAAWLFLMLQWWMPTCLIGTIFAFAESVPRLLVLHLIGLVVLWAVEASAVSWSVWWIKKSRLQGTFSPRRTGTRSMRKDSPRG